MKYKRLLLLSSSVALAFVFCFLMVAPAFAAIGNPTSVSIGEYRVFRDVLEEDDQLYFVRYDVSYSPTPEEDAEDTWQMAIYDTDGTTFLFDRPLNYYQHNIISIYLTPTDALTWGSEYKIKIRGNPAVFDPLVEGTNMLTRSLSDGDYYEASDLPGFILTQAGILEGDWEITLLDDAGLLNTTGATYFIEAVPGLGTMAPEIFSTVISTYTFTPTDFTHDYEEEVAEHRGERLNTALNNLGSTVGISGNWLAFLMCGILFAVFAGATFTATRQPIAGLLMGFGVVILAAWGVGLVSLTLIFVIVFVLAFFFAVSFIMGRFA